MAFGLLMVFPTLFAVSSVLAHAYHALLDGPWFRLEEVQISGLKNVDRKVVLNALGIPRHAGLLTVKVTERARALESIPWFRSTNVRVDYPDKIVVEVTEREPVAVVFADDFFLMDSEGKLFAETSVAAHSTLPLVTGFSGMGLKHGDQLPQEVMESVRQLIAALSGSQSWFPSNQISECRWHNEEGFILYTMLKAVPIELGWGDYEQKLARLQKVLSQLSQRRLLEMVTRIDLDYPNRAFITGEFPGPKGI